MEHAHSWELKIYNRYPSRFVKMIVPRNWQSQSVNISFMLFSKLKWLPIFDLIKLRKLFSILNNPDAPLCLKRKFNSLSSLRSTGLRTRSCAFNLQVPFLRSNSEKRTFAFSAATLFYCLDTDLKQIVSVSLSSTIFSSRLDNFSINFLSYSLSLPVMFLALRN